ncbi:hypothetical protein Dimus_014047 [Dionaea muscipula]
MMSYIFSQESFSSPNSLNSFQETEQLKILLGKEMQKIKKPSQLKQRLSVDKECQGGVQCSTDYRSRSKSKGSDQEIDLSLLKVGSKVASGTCGHLYVLPDSSVNLVINSLLCQLQYLMLSGTREHTTDKRWQSKS